MKETLNSFEHYAERIRQKNMSKENPAKGLLFILLMIMVALLVMVVY